MIASVNLVAWAEGLAPSQRAKLEKRVKLLDMLSKATELELVFAETVMRRIYKKSPCQW